MEREAYLSNKDAMNTTGHNLTNASKPGYSKQRIIMKTEMPIYAPHLNRAQKAGQLGQGIMVQSIERVRDDLLDIRIAEESHKLGYWTSKNKFISLLENVYNEPEEQSIRKRLNDFWESWQDLFQATSRISRKKYHIRTRKIFCRGSEK